MPTRRSTELKLGCFKKITSKSTCRHFRYAQSLHFILQLAASLMDWWKVRHCQQIQQLVVLATMLKNGFIYLPGIF